MNKKGFTLVELLAVIVILALLATIATTSVTKSVKDSKEELYNTQMLSIKAAAEAWGADNMYALPGVGECSYITLKDLKGYGLLDPNVINPKTNKPISDDFKIKITTTLTEYGNPKTTYELNPKNVNNCYKGMYTIGTLVYVNVSNINDDSCNKDTATGTNSGCMKFYVISDNNDRVDLILDHNTSNNVVWTSSTTNISGPNEVITALNSDTSSWNVEKPLNYTDSNINNTIVYSKARLISKEEIDNIKLANDNKIPTWLYGVSNYWTATSFETNKAYLVTSNGELNSAINTTTSGIRPVISVKKINLK